MSDISGFRFIIRSLYDFEKRLTLTEPLFEVVTYLEGMDILLSPTPHDIYTSVMTGSRDCVFG